MTADEKIALLEERVSRLETLLSKVVKLAMANPFARVYVKKIMQED